MSAKAISDPQNVPLKTVLNGETVQDGTTRYATHSSPRKQTNSIFPETRSSASARRLRTSRRGPHSRLAPSSSLVRRRRGRVHFSQLLTSFPGTPKGVGFVKKPPLYLKHGDQVTVWVDGGIGSLVNDVVEESKGAVKARL